MRQHYSLVYRLSQKNIFKGKLNLWSVIFRMLKNGSSSSVLYSIRTLREKSTVDPLLWRWPVLLALSALSPLTREFSFFWKLFCPPPLPLPLIKMIPGLFYPIPLVTVGGNLTLGRPIRVFSLSWDFFELHVKKRISPLGRVTTFIYETWEPGIHVEETCLRWKQIS